ncbi:MAG: hypothetical protein R2813_08155 [Flavobacteriales bacterium]
MHWCVFGLLICFAVATNAQEKFVITGRFKVDGGSNSGAQIVLEKDGKKVKTVDGSSRFEIPLDFQAVYVVSFEKDGYVTKRLRFDTHVPKERAEQGFFPFDFTVELFEQFDDVNVVVFNQPVGKISYSDLIDEFDYDTDYTQSIQTQIQQVLDEVEQKKEEKAVKAAEEKKQEEQLNKQVTTLTSSGDKNASSGKLEDALKNYEEASKLKDSPDLQKKIEDTKKKIEQQQQQQEKQKAFDKLVADAGAAAAAGDLEGAKKLYEQANGVISDDAKVKAALDKVNQQIAQSAQQEEEFKRLKAEAESALKAGNLQEAIEKADKAMKLKPDPSLEGVKKQAMVQQEEAAAKAKAQAEMEEEYNTLLAKGQKELDAGNFAAAKATFEEAKKINDSPEVQQQIAAANAKMEEKKKADEAAAQNEAKSQELLRAASDALAAGDLETAKAKANEANTLKGGSADGVLKSVAMAEKAAADAQAEKQKQNEAYAKLIDEGNQAFAAGDLTKAEESFKKAQAMIADKTEAIAGMEKVAAKKKEQDELAAKEAEAEAARKAEEEAKRKEFEDLLSQADEALAAGDFDQAKGLYSQAGQIVEDKRVAKGVEAAERGIQEKQNAALAEADKKAKYDEAMKAGDAAFASGNLEEAKKQFNIAAAIDKTPDLQAKLAQLELKMSELAAKQAEDEAAQKAKEAEAAKVAELDKQFSDLVAKGDKAMSSEKFEDAEIAYADALKLKQDDTVESKLNAAADAKVKAEEDKAAALLAASDAEKAALVDKEYAELVSEGDKAFAKNKLEEAESAYKKALSAKDVQYPKDQLAAIESKRKELAVAESNAAADQAAAAAKAKYDDVVKQADKLLVQGDLNGAEAKYNEAKGLLPDEAYPDGKLTEIKNLRDQERAKEVELAKASEQEREAQYQKAVANADAALAAGNLDEARKGYNDALKIKDDEYPKSKLKEIDSKEKSIADQNAADAKALAAQKAEKEAEDAKGQAVAELIAGGDKMFQSNKLEEARQKYNDALGYGPNETAEKKLKQIEGIIAQRAAAEKKSQEAAQAISSGSRESDQLKDIIVEEEKRQVTSKEPELETPPNKGVVVKGSPVVVGEDRVGAAAKSAPVAALSEDDKYDGVQKQIVRQDQQMLAESEQRRLKEKYPTRKTVETEKVGNSTITYVYLNEGDFVTVFKKVEHNWGGVFFFINDRATNQRYWEHETQ